MGAGAMPVKKRFFAEGLKMSSKWGADFLRTKNGNPLHGGQGHNTLRKPFQP